MALQENKALVKRFVQVVQNEHNLDALDEIFSPDFVDYGGMSNPPNREGVRAMFSAMNAAFPDGHWEILRQLADEDLVATHKTFHGTHQGSFMGIPPTGKEIAFDVIDIMTIKNGMIIEHRVVMDTLGMLQQLGAIPTPG